MMVPILNKEQEALVGTKGMRLGNLSGSNQQDLDPTIHYTTSVIVLMSE